MHQASRFRRNEERSRVHGFLRVKHGTVPLQTAAFGFLRRSVFPPQSILLRSTLAQFWSFTIKFGVSRPAHQSLFADGHANRLNDLAMSTRHHWGRLLYVRLTHGTPAHAACVQHARTRTPAGTAITTTTDTTATTATTSRVLSEPPLCPRLASHHDVSRVAGSQHRSCAPAHNHHRHHQSKPSRISVACRPRYIILRGKSDRGSHWVWTAHHATPVPTHAPTRAPTTSPTFRPTSSPTE